MRCSASKSTAAHDPNYFLINYLLRHLMEYLLLLPNRIMIRVVLSPISFIASLLASQPASWLSITDSVYMQIMVTNQATNAQPACTHGQLGRRATTRPKCAPNALQEVSKQLLLVMYVHTRYKNPSGLSVSIPPDCESCSAPPLSTLGSNCNIKTLNIKTLKYHVIARGSNRNE